MVSNLFRLLSRRGFPRADGTRALETNTSNEPPQVTSKSPLKVFTLEELREYDGSDPHKPIYISIRGIVFDVTKAREYRMQWDMIVKDMFQGRRHYRKGETYHSLAGKEASRAFLTGDLNNGVVDERIEWDSLSQDQRQDLEHWVEYFSSQYPQVGYLDNCKSQKNMRDNHI